MSHVQLKNTLNDSIKRLAQIITAIISYEELRQALTHEFDRGWSEIEVQEQENIMGKNGIQFLIAYTYDNIQSAAQEAAEKLRKEYSIGLMNDENATQLKERTRKVTDALLTRLDTISDTELTRAYNYGRDKAAASGKLSKKWLDVTMDERTSDICGHLHNKYGSEEQAIPIDAKFDGTHTGAPFHINCRTKVLYK
jgi:hypothetical protein